MRRNFSNRKRFYLDKYLIFLTSLLIVLSLIFIYSASIGAGHRKIIVQSVSALIGTGIIFVILSFDYRILKSYINHIYIISIALLIFVLIFGTGKEETGANSWIRFFGIGIQPSELVKISFSIFFGYKLEEAKNDNKLNNAKEILKLTAYYLIITLLVIMQNDTGTALVFTFMFVSMMFSAGLSLKYILWSFLALSVVLPLSWFMMAPYQRNRILVFLNPELDELGAGYQVLQSKIAIGSGEIFGRGYLSGPRNRLFLLPEKETDFIFGVIGEELGFIGCAIIVTLLFLLVFRIFYIAKNAKNDAGSLICIGLGSMFLFHIIENVCMCIGLLPVTGIPLPFLSYGGSSLITNLTAIGLILNINKASKNICFNKYN